MLTGFLEKLTVAKIHYVLSHNREDGISVEVAVPGQRWEVDFLNDDSIEVEIFKSDGVIFGKEKLAELFDEFSD
jgi:hypothetical protein